MSTPSRVNHGGLMRCCLQSLDNAMVKHDAQMTEPAEGDIVRCEWCSDEFGMVLKNGSWRWARPRDEEEP